METIQDTQVEVVYWLNQDDLIETVGGQWYQFAEFNGGISLLENDVKGKNIYSYVIGDRARMYLYAAIQHVRCLKKPLVKKYRCDSPGKKRYMDMMCVHCATNMQNNGK